MSATFENGDVSALVTFTFTNPSPTETDPDSWGVTFNGQPTLFVEEPEPGVIVFRAPFVFAEDGSYDFGSPGAVGFADGFEFVPPYAGPVTAG